MALQMDVHKWNETGKRCKEYMKLTDACSHRLELLSIFAESQYLQFLSQLFALLWVYLAATRLCNPVTLERQGNAVHYVIKADLRVTSWNMMQHINLVPL